MFKWLKGFWFDFKYRDIDPNVCCCGGYVGCNSGPCRSQKEYIKSLYLEGKWK